MKWINATENRMINLEQVAMLERESKDDHNIKATLTSGEIAYIPGRYWDTLKNGLILE